MGLPWRVRLAYAVGHVLNDLCASVWFTYTLVFFKFGVIVPTTLAGTIVLLGQIADGIATPLVGVYSDRISQDHPVTHETDDDTDTYSTSGDSGCRKCWRRFKSYLPTGRKAWHFCGSLLVIVTFPLLFGSPVGWMHADTWAKMLYYAPIVITFQVGWAAIQITHLALMNDLTLDPGERTFLTSLRHLFTVLSNLTVYLCTFFLLDHSKSNVNPPNNRNTTTLKPSLFDSIVPIRLGAPFVLAGHPLSGILTSTTEEPIDFGRDDLPAFRDLSLTIVGVGTIMTILFHWGVRNSDRLVASSTEEITETTLLVPSDDGETTTSTQSILDIRIETWKDWLRLPLFWVQGFFYMTVRVIVNVSQAYITVYLLQSLHLPKNTMALIPLTIYLTSVVTLIAQKPIQDRISRELNTILGLICVTGFCILNNYPGDPVETYRVYISAGILGIGCTTILITCLAMVSDLIGLNHANGAFVYGYMSFADKFANGLVIQIIESLRNELPSPQYYQNVESYGIGGWVLAGVFFLAIQTAVKKRTSIRVMGLPWRVRLAYAVGHVLNDLCASVWFTYTLVFFKFGVIIPTSLAGTIVLIGQIADGIATPLVGVYSDRISQHHPVTHETDDDTNDHLTSDDSCFRKCWRRFKSCLPTGRKAWHFCGSLLVIVLFPLLFGSPVGWMHADTWAKMIYYVPILIVFQVGWAAAQITHLALMNDLTSDPGERTLLTSLRYLFTVLSNLTVYLLTFFLLDHSRTTVDTSTNRNTTTLKPSLFDTIVPLHLGVPLVLAGHPSSGMLTSNTEETIDFGRDDLPAFRDLSLTIVGVGTIMTILFHWGVRNSDRLVASSTEEISETRSSDDEELVTMTHSIPHLLIETWKDWLRLPLFWIQALFYMTVRVIVNVSQSYITVYLLQSLHLPKNTMALVPLTIYLTSMVSVIAQKPIQDRISRELNTILGLLCVTVFCILTNYPGDPVQTYRVYIAAGSLGVGCTIITITCLAMVSDLIGLNHANGAVVYGYMSFADKFANGLVIQIIESLRNELPSPQYYQNVESYGIGGWVLAGVFLLAIQTAVKKRTYGNIHLFLLPSNSARA